MLHRFKHVGQGEVGQEFRFGTELGSSLDKKRAKRVHRTLFVIAAAARDFGRFFGSFLTLEYGVVNVEVERKFPVFVDPFHLVRQVVPRLQNVYRGPGIKLETLNAIG